MTTGVAEKLNRLLELIRIERDCAKRLDTTGLQQLSQEKELLISQLPQHTDLTDELKGLAETIRRENRRNAYLLWSALGFIRETMEFFHGQAAQPGYGAGGQDARNRSGGRLLSGKV